MIYFEHRKNKISELSSVQTANGVEIDLRSSVLSPGKIHLSHDPWVEGDDFEEWLEKFRDLGIQGTIILNTKEDSLEQTAVEKLKKYGLQKYIFLDTAFPTFIKWRLAGNASSFFLRISKYEDLASVKKFVGEVEWLWCDCFQREPLNDEILEEAARSFKLCLVSPELQGGSEDDFSRFRTQLQYFSAICTKKPYKWEEILKNA